MPSLRQSVATNTGGSRVLTHGDMSHHVLGVEAVIADEASRLETFGIRQGGAASPRARVAGVAGPCENDPEEGSHGP